MVYEVRIVVGFVSIHPHRVPLTLRPSPTFSTAAAVKCSAKVMHRSCKMYECCVCLYVQYILCICHVLLCTNNFTQDCFSALKKNADVFGKILAKRLSKRVSDVPMLDRK